VVKKRRGELGIGWSESGMGGFVERWDENIHGI